MTGFAERFNTVKCLKSSLLTLKTLPKPGDCPSLLDNMPVSPTAPEPFQDIPSRLEDCLVSFVYLDRLSFIFVLFDLIQGVDIRRRQFNFLNSSNSNTDRIQCCNGSKLGKLQFLKQSICPSFHMSIHAISRLPSIQIQVQLPKHSIKWRQS